MSYFFSNSPLSLGLIIPRGLCVSGHVVRAIFVSDTSEDAVQGLGTGEHRNKLQPCGPPPPMWTAIK